MGGRGDEDELGNPVAPEQSAAEIKALAKYAEASKRALTELEAAEAAAAAGEGQDKYRNMRVGGGLNDGESDGDEVEDDDEDDQEDEYRVFGRQTMKAQSEALYEVTAEEGGDSPTGANKKQGGASKKKAAVAAPSPIKE